MISFTIKYIILICASIVSVSANASFLGNDILYEYIYPDINSSFEHAIFTVGDGVEYITGTSGRTVIDLTANTITIGPNLGIGTGQSLDYSLNGGSAQFNGYRFSDATGLFPSILSVDIDKSTTLSGFSLDRISFTQSSIALNLGNLYAGANDLLVLNVTFVPLPSSIWLFSSMMISFYGLTSRSKMRAVRWRF